MGLCWIQGCCSDKRFYRTVLQNNPQRVSHILRQIDNLRIDAFQKTTFYKCLAMASVGGGWHSDYDNFPLVHASQRTITDQLPNRGKVTIHDMFSPSLASGAGNEWLKTLECLLADATEDCQNALARQKRCCWTDSLGMNRFRTTELKTVSNVAVPYASGDPVVFNRASMRHSKQFNGKLTVHFGQEMLLESPSVPEMKRHPKYRMELASDWIQRWKQICASSTRDDESMLAKGLKILRSEVLMR